MIAERRNLTRRAFTYYMRVMDEATGELIGHISDISTTGFKLDCKKPIPPNTLIKMRIENIGPIANKNFMTFVACSRWCKRDEYDMSMYNAGFQLTNIATSDYDTFVKMYNNYGVSKPSHTSTNLWS